MRFRLRSTILTFISIVSIILFCSSCETSNNGDLDGLWLMVRVDSMQNSHSQEVRKELISWSFEKNLFQCYNHRTDMMSNAIMGRFEHNEENLIIHDMFRYNRMEGDIALTTDSIELLKPYGINQLPDTFFIEKIDKRQLKIANQIVRLCFDKY